MRRSALVLAAVLGLAGILPGAHAALARCGVERWAVKTGTDPDAHLVDLSSSTPTTIATMRSWMPPNPIPANGRVSPPETTVWVVDAVLTQYKVEDTRPRAILITTSSSATRRATP
jgi:hypothetical protein